MPRPEPLDGFWYYFTYMQYVPGYWHAETPAFSRLFLHSWTLAIEEQFYILWPIVTVLLGRKRLILAIVPLLIVPNVLRAWGYHRHMMFTRCDGLALGALLALMFLDSAKVVERRVIYRRIFISTGVVALLARQLIGPMLSRLDVVQGGFWSVWTFAFGTAELAWLHFALVGLVLIDQGKAWLKPLRHPALVHTGTISYGIYLYHPFVLIFVPMIHKAMGIKGSPWMDVLKVLICVALAELSWRLIERPILKSKDRFAYRTKEGPVFQGPHKVATQAIVQGTGPSGSTHSQG
jgi:peptidoglycan/LPS O-acetylase OafA/YrhL